VGKCKHYVARFLVVTYREHKHIPSQKVTFRGDTVISWGCHITVL